jgi:ferric-dicitrate binding protein FerR (iron transport regulator)
MKHHAHSPEEFLDYCFAPFREMPQSQIESVCDRVLQLLRDEGSRGYVPAPPSNSRSRWFWPRLAAVGAIVAIVVGLLVGALSTRDAIQITDALGSVQWANGSLSYLTPGQILRTDGVPAFISLQDASRVEVREQSELYLERTNDGLRIRLNQGSVIVNAAQQVARLYVQTKDLTVAVTGTVFLVTAEETESRVAVVQGEVSVRDMTAEIRLMQGQQWSTTPPSTLEVSEEIAWSQNVEIHLEQLQSPAMTIQERCGPTDLRSIVRDNGGWNLRLPGVLWRKYKCQHGGD